MERITLKIDGMTCNNCVGHVTKALREMPGVSVEQVGIGSATLSYDAARTSEQQIARTIEDEGYSVAGATP